MTYQEQERSERQLFGFLFQATTDEYNEVLRRTYETPEFIRHDMLHQLASLGRFSAFDPRARAMVEELGSLYLQLRAVVAGFAAEVLQ